MWRSSVAAGVALLLFGCGNRDEPATEPPPPGYPVSLDAVLQNQKDARSKDPGEGKILILKDYGPSSIVKVRTEAFDTGEGMPMQEYSGLTQIGVFFDDILKDLQNFEVVFEKQPDEAKVMVKAWFLCWRSLNSGYWGVSETFVFDESLKISVHNINIIKSARTSLSVSQESLTKVARSDSNSVAEAVTKHEDALNNVPVGNGCPDNCIDGGIPAAAFENLYADGSSTIYMMDWDDLTMLKEYEGTVARVTYYNELSEGLPSIPSKAGYQFTDKSITDGVDIPSAFLQWTNQDWKSASNTLVYRKDYKILFHTITKRAVTTTVDFTV